MDAGARSHTGADTPVVERNAAIAHDAALDGLRAVAVGLVVLTHAGFLTGFTTSGGLLGRLFGRGDFGVLLFFALSAYLLHRNFLRAEAAARPLAIGRYLARRAARVLPAYWVTLAGVTIVVHPPARAVVLNALAGQVYVSDAIISEFSQSWSVATELSFYLALPFLVIVLRAVRTRGSLGPTVLLLTFAALSLVGLAASRPVSLGEDVLPERLLTGTAPAFLLGMLLAEAGFARNVVSRLLMSWATRAGACVTIAFAVYVLATTPVTGSLLLAPNHGPQLATRVLLGTIVSIALMLPLTLGSGYQLRRVLAQPWVRWTGEVSYGIFLWHLPVFMALMAVFGWTPFTGGLLPLLALGVPVTLGLAWLSHRWLELPFMRRAARLGRHSGG